MKSSKPHRNAQRTNGVAEIAVGALKTISPIAVVPGKLAQGLNSGYAFFHTPKISEKSIHVFQCSLALTQLIIAAVLFFRSEDCKDGGVPLCKGALILELLYQGTLMAAWVPSELMKEGMESPMHSPSASSGLIA